MSRAFGAVVVAVLTAVSCGAGSGRNLPPPTSGLIASTAPARTAPAPPPPTVRAVQVAHIDEPVGMAVRAGDPALYLVSKRGAVWALRAGRLDPAPALDLRGQVSHDTEQGLLGLAFSPDGWFAYADYTDLQGNTNVVEYAWKDGTADPSTRRPVLFVRQPFPNHNGGELAFGPDGDLYVGLGDGGANEASGPDPHGNGQNLGVLLGKILRIQPRGADESLPPGGASYTIPLDNPFVGRSGARPEIWAYGLRNPWRYSFDRQTRDLWIADVGAGTWEEVDVQGAGTPGGQNFGWSRLEGTNVLQNPPPPPADAVPPVYEYDHRTGGCAITGGYVYRGGAIPALRGWYVFGDFCLGVIKGLRFGDGQPDAEQLGATVPQLSSFGQDQQGELYAISLGGEVSRLEP